MKADRTTQTHHTLSHRSSISCSSSHTLPHTFTRPSSYFRIPFNSNYSLLTLTQTFFSFHKPWDNLSDFTAEHIQIYHLPQFLDISEVNCASSMCVKRVCLYCKCLCMTCHPISKPTLLFPLFLWRKTDWEKTSRMPSVSTLSFKSNLI